jgi:hypothetical protein
VWRAWCWLRSSLLPQILEGPPQAHVLEGDLGDERDHLLQVAQHAHAVLEAAGGEHQPGLEQVDHPFVGMMVRRAKSGNGRTRGGELGSRSLVMFGKELEGRSRILECTASSMGKIGLDWVF